MICGGHSQAKEPDQEIIQMANNLRSEMESQAGFTFTQFNVLSYTTQVVAGINYKLKIQVGEKTIDVVIYKPLPHTNQEPTVTSVQSN